MNRLRGLGAVTAAFVLLGVHGAVAAPQATLAQALAAARTSLVVSGAGFSGDAAPVLTSAIAQSRYVLIGEDHLSREIPAFATAVCDVMAKDGLAAMAVETGPQVAKFVQPLLAGGTAQASLHQLTARYPNSVAFLDMRAEADLVTHCAQAAGPDRFQLWGLDQEFLGSAGWLLDLALARKLSPTSRTELTALKSEEQQDAHRASASGDPSQLLIFAASTARLAHAVQTVRADHDADALNLVQELLDTHNIYTNPSGAESNRDRGLLLKHNLLQKIVASHTATSQERVLLKFGDTHLTRGFNELHQRDLGNFVAELADAQGVKSLHICVLGARGTHLAFSGYNRPGVLSPFVLADDPDYTWIKPAIAALSPAGWSMFDLRSLRFRKLAGEDADWARIIYGYDLLVIIPSLTPTAPL